jgi:hypothetical protein
VPAAASPTASTLSSLADSGSLVNNGWFQLANTWGNQFASSGFPINLLSLFAQTSQVPAIQGVSDIGKGLSQGEAALGASEAELASAFSAAGRAQAPTAALGVGVSMGKLTTPPAVVGLLPAS